MGTVPDVEAQVSGRAWSQDVRGAVRRLDPTQGRIIAMIYFERRTQHEVAAELKLSRRKVANAVATALQALAAGVATTASD